MDFHEAVKQVRAMPQFKHLPKTCHLAHAFVMKENEGEEWQIGYFCPDTDRMISFIVDEEVHQLPPAEVLKSDIAIKTLDPANVKISAEEALAIAEKVRLDHYKASMPMKTFFLIQHLPEGTVYNLTYVTRQFTTLNIKIDAKDGTVVKHSNEPLISFDKGGK